MANDFSWDSRCVALYRFETAPNFLKDSQGSNTLLDHNGVEEDLVNYKEGTCSALFTQASSQYLHISEGILTLNSLGKTEQPIELLLCAFG